MFVVVYSEADVRLKSPVRSIATGLAALGMGIALSHAQPRTRSEAENSNPIVSLVAVISNPKSYDNRKIQFVGYLRLGFESDTVFLSAADGDHYISKNGIKLEDSEVCSRSAKDRSYVLMVGEFLVESPRDLYSGTLRRITSCTPYPTASGQ